MADVNALKKRIKDMEQELKNSKTSQGLPLPEFYDGSEELDCYLRRFNKVATAHSWNAVRCTTILPLYLRGQARALYDSLPDNEKDTWVMLTTNLARNLSRLNSKESARRVLAERCQKNDESILEFADALRKLTDKAFPNSSFIQVQGETADARANRIRAWKDDITKDYFRNGLKPDLKERVLYMPANTLNDAVAQAREIEQILEALSLDKIRIEEDDKAERAMDEVNAVRVELEAIREQITLNTEPYEYMPQDYHIEGNYRQDFPPYPNLEQNNEDYQYQQDYDDYPYQQQNNDDYYQFQQPNEEDYQFQQPNEDDYQFEQQYQQYNNDQTRDQQQYQQHSYDQIGEESIWDDNQPNQDPSRPSSPMLGCYSLWMPGMMVLLLLTLLFLVPASEAHESTLFDFSSEHEFKGDWNNQTMLPIRSMRTSILREEKRMRDYFQYGEYFGTEVTARNTEKVMCEKIPKDKSDICTEEKAEEKLVKMKPEKPKIQKEGNQADMEREGTTKQ